jgi:hypothetical protein
MASKKDVIKELKTLGVKFDETVNAKELEALLVEKKAEIAKQNGGADNADQNAGDENKPEATVKKNKGTVYVWLKTRAYVSENQRVDAGFYLVEEVPARFRKMKSDTVEIFENEIPHKKVYDIAKWCGKNLDNFVGEDQEILDELASELKPFV